ncbi:hypothetical protein MMPV_007362 [Pyropia vietnamensis]
MDHMYNNPEVSAVEARQAREVSSRFREQASKFSGRTEQLWDDYRIQYDLVTRDFGVALHQKLQLLHNLLGGEALRFYLDDVIRAETTYEAACGRIRARFLSPVHQGRARNYLQSLRMSAFVAKGMSEVEALEETYKVVARVSKKVPREFSGDAHRAIFLRSAVIGYPWAMHPLSRMDVHDISFQDLYGELYAALSLQRDASSAAARDRAASEAVPSESMASTFYGGQERYGVAATTVGRRALPRVAGVRKPIVPPRAGGCFNCGDPSHRLADCTRPVDWTAAMRRRAEYWSQRRPAKDVAATVMYELCEELQYKSTSPGDGPSADGGEVDATTDNSLTGRLDARAQDCDDAVDIEKRTNGDSSAAEDLFYAMAGHKVDDEVAKDDVDSDFMPGV